MRRLAFFLGVLAALLIVAGVTTWRVDPFSEFYDHGVLVAAESNAAPCLISNGVVGPNGWLSFKLDVLHSRHARVVVIGSSRVLKIASHSGEQDFANLGIPGTGVDTVEAIFHRIKAANHGPLTVYIGVELFWFNKTYSTDVPANADAMDKLRYLLDREDVRLSARTLLRDPSRFTRRWHIEQAGGRCVIDLPGAPVAQGRIDAWETDGSFEYRFELVPSAERPTPEYKQDLVTFESPYYRDWIGLDQSRVHTLARALAYAHAAGWRVVGFVPPYSARYRDRLASATETAAEWRAFAPTIAPFFTRYGFPFLDFRDAASIPCRDSEFVDDGIHPNAACAARIRDKLDIAARTMAR